MAGLLERYSGLVYGTACRVLGCRDLAEDVTQEVFSRLPREAGGIRPPALGAWLHRAALRAALNMRRAEMRRRQREVAAVENWNAPDDQQPHPALDHLDAALQSLSDSERGLVIERFHGGASFEAIARSSGKSPDAARMVVNRALEKMRGFFQSRGAALSVTALASLLGAELSRGAPANFLSAPQVLAAAKSAPAAGFSLATLTTLIMTKPLFLALAAILVFLACWGGGYFANRPESPELAIVRPAPPPAAVAHQEVQSQIAPDLPPPGNSRAAEALRQLLAAEKELEEFPQTDRDALEAKTLEFRRRAREIVQPLGVEDAAEALALVSKQPSRFAKGFLLEGVVRFDPERAKTLAGPEERTEADQHSPLGRAYGFHDPQAALQAMDRWYANDASLRAVFQRGVWTGWMERDTPSSVAALERLPVDDQNHLVAMYKNFSSLSSQREATAAAVSALTDETLRSQVVIAATGDWARTNPKAAAAWFDRVRWQDSEAAFEPAMAVAERWVEQGRKDENRSQIEAALLWVEPRVPPAARPKMLRTITRKFADYPAVLEAYQKQP